MLIGGTENRKVTVSERILNLLDMSEKELNLDIICPVYLIFGFICISQLYIIKMRYTYKTKDEINWSIYSVVISNIVSKNYLNKLRCG